ncbi:hypothetical protein AB0H07_47160 [Streptomyces sp. NPDC021354]|uniref:hypothetical protein n=1 Tax=Streptomyces sp. NPDC021354 TaxID=3154793 RepID=UPI0033DB0403
MSGGETSGVDLARVALRAAMAQARQNGGGQKAKSKPRPVRTARRDGREPMDLGPRSAHWSPSGPGSSRAAGASPRERWAAIAPELAGHVAAIGYDAEHRTAHRVPGVCRPGR